MYMYFITVGTSSPNMDAAYIDHIKRCCYVSGVKNPVLVADSLLRTQMRGEMSLGRIPPR